MKSIFISIVLLLTTIPALAYARTAEEGMNDALGRAYKSATEKKLDDSKSWFRKAAEYAREANSWQGLIDAGYGLSTLGLPDEASMYFDSACELIIQDKDWHGGVALGYAYSSLPDRLNVMDKAIKIWTDSKTWAKNKNDLFGLIEVGRGFMSINKNTIAEECLDLARIILKEAPTEKGIKALVEAYRRLGKEDKALECTRYSPGSISSALPSGWKPTAGETIRKPKTVPVTIQQAQRTSADRDIQARQEWERQQAELKQQEKLERQHLAYAAYRDYLYYYSYPYYGVYSGLISSSDDYYIYTWTSRPVWTVRTYPEIYNWALWNLSRYSYVDGIYIAVDLD